MFLNHQKAPKVAGDFLKFVWCKMLNCYVNLSFNMLSMRVRYQSKRWETEDDLNNTWIMSHSLDI